MTHLLTTIEKERINKLLMVTKRIPNKCYFQYDSIEVGKNE